jgi:hypothetical protein
LHVHIYIYIYIRVYAYLCDLIRLTVSFFKDVCACTHWHTETHRHTCMYAYLREAIRCTVSLSRSIFVHAHTDIHKRTDTCILSWTHSLDSFFRCCKYRHVHNKKKCFRLTISCCQHVCACTHWHTQTHRYIFTWCKCLTVLFLRCLCMHTLTYTNVRTHEHWRKLIGFIFAVRSEVKASGSKRWVTIYACRMLTHTYIMREHLNEYSCTRKRSEGVQL